jgi:hypothetical protein
VTIDSAEALRRLMADPAGAAAADPVEVRLPFLGAEESERFRREVERYGAACGCDTGAAAVVLGLAAFAAWWVAAGFPGGAALGVAGAGATLLGAGAAGKAWGLVRARRRFRRAVREVLARVEGAAAAA